MDQLAGRLTVPHGGLLEPAPLAVGARPQTATEIWVELFRSVILGFVQSSETCNF